MQSVFVCLTSASGDANVLVFPMRHPPPLAKQRATSQSVARLYKRATCTRRAATVRRG